MNHAGEITVLAKIAKPDLVLVTMVGSAHIGELGSAAAVAAAKEELYQAAPNAMAIFNIDNQWTRAMWERDKARDRPRVLTFSAFDKEADVHLRADRIGLDHLNIVGKIVSEGPGVSVPVGGRQNVNNIMAATAIALALDMPPAQIWQQLANLKTTWGRGQLLKHSCGAQIIFDGYNANPESVTALLRGLLEIDGAGHRIAILGDMLELGPHAGRAHETIGEIAGNVQLHTIWYIGQHAKEFQAGLTKARFAGEFMHSPKMDQGLATYVSKKLSSSDLVVIKGSRGMKMEQILTSWGIPND
jgi:UDP-N-acetylmuramoyl-tripeptide--D-alanyl-D-alanine ligase